MIATVPEAALIMAQGSLMFLVPAMLLSSLAVVELFFRLPFLRCVEKINRSAMQALSIVRSPRVSDHWKERVLPAYARRILQATLNLAAMLLLCAVAFLLLYLALAWWPAGSWRAALATLENGVVQLWLLGIGIGWALVRARWTRRGRSNSDYSTGAQMLHRLALGSDGMRTLVDELDLRWAGARATDTKVDRPVYVTSLARAGTTVLLEALHASGHFTSLTYRSMPFVMAPWIWGAVSSSRRAGKAKRKERAHGDRLQVSVDSPEAFEEVFWDTYARRSHWCPDGLALAGVPPEGLLERYRGFVRRILARGAAGGVSRRYLCKNNNNLLRLHWIFEAFPDALVITPFRHPADHVQSLLRQHRRFLKRHREDSFALDYMDWLGHHEFGAHFKPFLLGERVRPPPSPEALLEPAYWMAYWCELYRFLLDCYADRLIWFDHDAFCEKPQEQLETLAAHLGVPSGSLLSWSKHVSPSKHEASADVQAAVTPDALALHAALCTQALKVQSRRIAPD
jgi:hypothetical protein